METLNVRKGLIILVFGVIGWAICGAIMFIGMEVTTLRNALIIHSIGAPLVFLLLTILYYKKFNYTSPLQTAFSFISIVILLDIFVVAILINKSFVMFRSAMGTWLPFILIFLTTYIAGNKIMQNVTSKISR